MFYIKKHILQIIEEYKGTKPLSHFLKSYFQAHPILGSRDRKLLSEMSYSFYRFSKGLKENLELLQLIEAALFLSESNLKAQERILPQIWLPKPELLSDKIAVLNENNISFSSSNIASFKIDFSNGITPIEWENSLMQQPNLFIRIRKNVDKIKSILEDNNIEFETINENCLSLKNTAPIDKILPPTDYVIQDVSSQLTGKYFTPKNNEMWWDCCSGAGGKSILLKDIEPNIQLTVSDVRPSILHNLSERFKLHEFKQPQQIIADVSDAHSLSKNLQLIQFDNIICDVPCTGSGTWARTPEQLYFFKESMINFFSERQKRIAANSVEFLKENGRLIYITCSVFKEENENVVTYLAQKKNLTLESMELINGTAKKADSLFVAVLRKSS